MEQERRPPDWMTDDQKELWLKAFGKPGKKKASPANQLTDAVMRYMRSLRCAVARINTTGIYDQELGRYRFSGSTNGVEDVSGTLPITIQGLKIGLTVAVEIKIGKDRLSEDQIKRKENIEKAGGHYIVAKTFDQFKKEFDQIVHQYDYVAKGSGTA